VAKPGPSKSWGQLFGHFVLDLKANRKLGIDPQKGYISSNAVWVCRAINGAKNKFHVEDFRVFLHALARTLKENHG
jgi:hypothetical protein